MQKWNISYYKLLTKLSGKPRHIAHIQLATILNTGTFLLLTSK